MSYITCIQRHCSIQFKKNIQVAKFIDWSEHGKFLSAHVLQVHVVTCRLHYSSPLTHTPSSLCCLPPQLQINLLPHLCLLQLTIFIFFFPFSSDLEMVQRMLASSSPPPLMHLQVHSSVFAPLMCQITMAQLWTYGIQPPSPDCWANELTTIGHRPPLLTPL